MSNNKPPEHLEDQLIYVYLRAFQEIERCFPLKENRVFLKSDHIELFKDVFAKLRYQMSQLMIDRSNQGKDSHKLAALACLTVLLVRPIISKSNGEAHALNEVMAYLISGRIIQLYQLNRFCKSREQREKIKNKLGFITPPPLIYDQNPVNTNTIIALAFLSRALATEKLYPIDLSLLLSSFFFYIDVTSQGEVERLAKEM